MQKRLKFGECPLCQRTCELSFHHLIPKKLHRRTHYKKHYSKEELNHGVDICRLCHNGLHALYDEMTLAKCFSTLEEIISDRDLSKHTNWVKKQKT